MTGINRQSMNGNLSLQVNNKTGLALAEIMSTVVAVVPNLSANNGLSFSRKILIQKTFLKPVFCIFSVLDVAIGLLQ
jgi:hypothetical protein